MTKYNHRVDKIKSNQDSQLLEEGQIINKGLRQGCAYKTKSNKAPQLLVEGQNTNTAEFGQG